MRTDPPGEKQRVAAGPMSRLRGLRTFQALRYPEFRQLWLGQGCISIGLWMDQVTRGWLLYELTNSPLQLGLIRGIQAIPLLLLSPVAGTAADRYDRKLQMLVAQSIDAVLYGVLAVLVLTGQVQPWHVYATALLSGVVQTFQNPARQAMVADAVPNQHLINAIGLNSVLFNLSRSVGPSIAGVLIATLGIGASFVVQTALYALASVWTWTLPNELRFPRRVGGEPRKRDSFRESTVEGWRFGWSNVTVRAALLIAAFAAFFIIPFSTLLPVYARDILEAGASGQGVLLSAMGIGALASAVLVASLGDQLPRGLLMLGGVTVYGIVVVVFSASTWFPLSVGMMVLIGVLHVSSHSLVQTVVQSYTPSELRGRVGGTFQQTHVILTLGSMLIGGIASVIGAPLAMAVMAAAGAVCAAVMFATMPHARAIR